MAYTTIRIPKGKGLGNLSHPNLHAGVGRVRATSVVSPSEAGYIKKVQQSAKRIEAYVETVLRGLQDATPDIIMEALWETIIPRSQELVPVFTGRLYNSAYVEERKTVRGPEVYFGYAKHGNPHYAVFVHEATWMRHRKGKSAKFLEIAVAEQLVRFRTMVVHYMYEAFLKGLSAKGKGVSSWELTQRMHAREGLPPPSREAFEKWYVARYHPELGGGGG